MKYQKKGLRIILIVLVLCAVCFGILSYHPFLSRKCEVPEAYVPEIYAEARGVYSRTIPFVPVRISIERLSGERVYYTIHYFPFGTLEMSYDPVDGYNQEKPLFPFS